MPVTESSRSTGAGTAGPRRTIAPLFRRPGRQIRQWSWIKLWCHFFPKRTSASDDWTGWPRRSLTRTSSLPCTRREAVYSSQIEGTQSTLDDVGL
jgi:hypothetical protein